LGKGKEEKIPEATKINCTPVGVEGLSVRFQIPGMVLSISTSIADFYINLNFWNFFLIYPALKTDWCKLINVRTGLETRKETEITIPFLSGGKFTICVMRYARVVAGVG
jgi:hypothetical protein